MSSPRTLSLLLAAVPLLASCGSLIVLQRSVDSLRSQSGFQWTRSEIDGFAIYAEPGSESASELEVIAEASVRARDRVLEYAGASAYAPLVSVFAVDSRDRMRDLIGRRTNATGFYSSNAICLVWPRTGRSGLTHELTHLVTMGLWGVPDRWVNEGVAVDATGPWHGHDTDAVCKVLRRNGRLPSLNELTRRFGSVPSAQSYPAVGSFIRFLREQYGKDALRRVWDEGRSALPDVTEVDIERLEALWLARVDAADAAGVEYDPVGATPVDDR